MHSKLFLHYLSCGCAVEMGSIITVCDNKETYQKGITNDKVIRLCGKIFSFKRNKI